MQCKCKLFNAPSSGFSDENATISDLCTFTGVSADRVYFFRSQCILVIVCYNLKGTVSAYCPPVTHSLTHREYSQKSVVKYGLAASSLTLDMKLRKNVCDPWYIWDSSEMKRNLPHLNRSPSGTGYYGYLSPYRIFLDSMS